MDTAAIEQQPVMFSNACSALAWADSIIAVGRCDSQIYRIMRDAVQQGVRATNGVTLDDLRCEAHDISNALQQVTPYHLACTLRHLYGLPSAHESIQAVFHVADQLEPNAEGMRRVKIRALALAAMNHEKAVVNGGRPYSMSRFARSVGVSKQTFSDSHRWMELRAAAAKQVKAMGSEAEKKLADKLGEKGVM